MARELSDREDLLAEGVNLPERGRITDVSAGREWIAGWRNQSALSIFDGVELVFQFNTSGLLRRVFIDGRKLAANAGRLTRLVRRSDSLGRMTHEAHVLSTEDQDRVLQRLNESVADLKHVLSGGQAKIETIGISPDIFAQRLTSWTVNVNCLVIAHGPGVMG